MVQYLGFFAEAADLAILDLTQEGNLVTFSSSCEIKLKWLQPLSVSYGLACGAHHNSSTGVAFVWITDQPLFEYDESRSLLRNPTAHLLRHKTLI